MDSPYQDLVKCGVLERSAARRLMLDALDGAFSPPQLGAIMGAWARRFPSPPELLGCIDGAVTRMVQVDLGTTEVVDVCGTGGDEKNTFNISTATAFVVAGAGVLVAKHGNHGFSSSCGSSTVLEALGVPLRTNPSLLRRDLDEIGLCFIHGPLFHPGLATVAPVRRAFGMRTFFNLLGPLLNPAQPRWRLVGVSARPIIRLYESVLSTLGSEYSVVHTHGGYDEISLTAPFDWVTPQGWDLVHPEDLGLSMVEPEELYGGSSAEQNAQLIVRILDGVGTVAQEAVIVANAALALHTVNPRTSLFDCVSQARESIVSGRARRCLAYFQGLP